MAHDRPSSSRWIRLDTTWSSSSWVAELPPEGRLAWVELLCHVKAHGTAGRVRALSAVVAARMWGVTRDSVTGMLEAAQIDGALVVEDGEWVLTGWSTYQPDKTARDRQRRHRQRQQLDTPVIHTPPVTPVTRDVRYVTPTKTETGTKTEETEELPPPDGGEANAVVLRDWRDGGPGTWTGAHVVAAFMEYCRKKHIPELPPSARAKQGAAGKRLAKQHRPADIVQAMVGMGTLFPHCPPRNEPWDLFDLETKFTKAHAAAGNDPALREAAFDDAFLRRAS